MVDQWEVEQNQYTRTLYVLEHIQHQLAKLFGDPDSPGTKGCPPGVSAPRTMLVCGADVVESMGDASVWKQDLLQVRHPGPSFPF